MIGASEVRRGYDEVDSSASQLERMEAVTTHTTQEAIGTREGQETEEMNIGRCDPVEYFTEYAPSWSTQFQNRSQMAFRLVDASQRHRNDAYWAKCCFTFVKRKQKTSLGHPIECLERVSTLIRTERIYSEKELTDFLKKTLPRNERGELQLPQINMKHSSNRKEDIKLADQVHGLHRKVQLHADKTESRLVFLEAMLEDLTKENHLLKADMIVT